MKYKLRFYLYPSLCRILLAVILLKIQEVHGKIYLLGERANLSCRFDKIDSNLADTGTLQQIDVLLDQLYDPTLSNIKMDGKYGEDCNQTIEFEFSFEIWANESGMIDKTKNDKSVVCMDLAPNVSNATRVNCIKKVKSDLTNLLETLEIKRDRYEQGLWGYCSKEGAAELMYNITRILNAAKNDTIKMCNRSKLLMCHRRFKKCQCMVDNKNFREIASEYWDDAEEKEDTGFYIGKNQCVLNVGSDCPIGNDSGFMCMPKSKCLRKETRSLKDPCNTLHENAKDVNMDTPNTRSIAKMLYSRSLSLQEMEFHMIGPRYEHTVSDNTSILAKIMTTEIPSNVTIGEAGFTRLQNKKTTRHMRYDYFSNVHCQCYGFIGGTGKPLAATSGACPSTNLVSYGLHIRISLFIASFLINLN